MRLTASFWRREMIPDDEANGDLSLRRSSTDPPQPDVDDSSRHVSNRNAPGSGTGVEKGMPDLDISAGYCYIDADNDGDPPATHRYDDPEHPTKQSTERDEGLHSSPEIPANTQKKRSKSTRKQRGRTMSDASTVHSHEKGVYEPADPNATPGLERGSEVQECTATASDFQHEDQHEDQRRDPISDKDSGYSSADSATGCHSDCGCKENDPAPSAPPPSRAQSRSRLRSLSRPREESQSRKESQSRSRPESRSRVKSRSTEEYRSKEESRPRRRSRSRSHLLREQTPSYPAHPKEEQEPQDRATCPSCECNRLQTCLCFNAARLKARFEPKPGCLRDPNLAASYPYASCRNPFEPVVSRSSPSYPYYRGPAAQYHQTSTPPFPGNNPNCSTGQDNTAPSVRSPRYSTAPGLGGISSDPRGERPESANNQESGTKVYYDPRNGYDVNKTHSPGVNSSSAGIKPTIKPTIRNHTKNTNSSSSPTDPIIDNSKYSNDNNTSKHQPHHPRARPLADRFKFSSGTSPGISPSPRPSLRPISRTSPKTSHSRRKRLIPSLTPGHSRRKSHSQPTHIDYGYPYVELYPFGDHVAYSTRTDGVFDTHTQAVLDDLSRVDVEGVEGGYGRYGQYGGYGGHGGYDQYDGYGREKPYLKDGYRVRPRVY